MRQSLARLARVAAIVAIGVLAVGLLMLAVGAVIAGDLYAIRQPWSGLGIDLAVVGAAATAITLAARVLLEPLGRSRLLGVPPAAVTALLWGLLIFLGLGSGGACCGPNYPGIGTELYSAPLYAGLLIAATLLIGLPLALPRLRARRGAGSA